MARILHGKLQQNGNSQKSYDLRGQKIQKKRQKHKLVLHGPPGQDEAANMMLSFHTEPPVGYTFIPAGNTQLTAAMKTFAKRAGRQVMAVSTTQHAARHELSREVHRVGYHFPTEIVDEVCNHYGIRLDSSGRLINDHGDDQLYTKMSQKGEELPDENPRDQVTINTEAKEIIRDLFPKIPDNDLFKIIKTAFQLGKNRVGTAEDVPLVRRAQLSVVAHIRHTYSKYDKLLRQMPYNEARHMVEEITLRKLVEWRGERDDEDNEKKQTVDEAVREAIVLDDDDTDSELEEGQVAETSRQVARAQKAPVADLIPTEHRALSADEFSADEENLPKCIRLPPEPKRMPTTRQVPNAAMKQQSRYAIYDQVRRDYRSGVPMREPIQVVYYEPSQESSISRSIPTSQTIVYESPRHVQYVVEEQRPIQVSRHPSPSRLFRGADGKLFEVVESGVVPRALKRVSNLYAPSSSHPSVIERAARRRSASPQQIRVSHAHRTPSMNDNGIIVPSIEPADHSYLSPIVKQNPFGNLNSTQTNSPHHSRGDEHMIPLEPLQKKARMSNDPPSPYLNQRPILARRRTDRDEQQPLTETSRYVHTTYDSPHSRTIARTVPEMIPLTPDGQVHNQRRSEIIYRENLPPERSVQYVYADTQQPARYRYVDEGQPMHIDSRPIQYVYEVPGSAQRMYLKENQMMPARRIISDPYAEPQPQYVVLESGPHEIYETTHVQQ